MNATFLDTLEESARAAIKARDTIQFGSNAAIAFKSKCVPENILALIRIARAGVIAVEGYPSTETLSPNDKKYAGPMNDLAAALNALLPKQP